MDVALLIDRPEFIGRLAEAYRAEWPDWYDGGPGDALADLRERARRDGLPIGLVLAEGNELIATAAITGPTLERWAHLTPWLGGGWTRPDLRGRGYGAMLAAAAVNEARRLGYHRLHVATTTAVGLMHRLGWACIDTAMHDGEVLSLFATDVEE